MAVWLRIIASRRAASTAAWRPRRPEQARQHPGPMDEQALEAGLAVLTWSGPVGGADQPAVTDLAAALGVEGRPVQDQLDLVALAGRVDLLAVARSSPRMLASAVVVS